MESGTKSNTTVYNTISQFNNSDIETPDEFANSAVNTQISHELDNFITLQQQLQQPQTLTIHQLSQSIIPSNPSTPSPSSHYTPLQNPTSSSTPSSSTNRAYRTLKKNSQILHFHLTQEHPQHCQSFTSP